MKKISILAILVFQMICGLGQTIHNNGAYIVSQSGSYLVVGNGNFTLTSAPAKRHLQSRFEHH